MCLCLCALGFFMDEPFPPPSSQAMGERFCEPCISMERSRCQVLCRTGFRGPGQSWVLKYGPGKTHRDEAAALKAAQAWLASVKR